MALKTTAEQLEEVQAAISKVMAGQAVMVEGKSLTRADLKALTDREERLLARYKAETGTGGMAINYGVTRRDY
jgi:hypothetical protein